MLVQCPQCRAEIEYSVTNKHRPFCSERCQLIDLGQWAEGRYAIPVENQNDHGQFLDESEMDDASSETLSPSHSDIVDNADPSDPDDSIH